MFSARPFVSFVAGAASMLVIVVVLVVAVRVATAANEGTAQKAPGAMVTKSASFTVGIGKFDFGTAFCPEGMAEVSGGYQVTSGNFVYITASGPHSKNGWYVSAFVPNAIAEPGVSPAKITVVAKCARIGQAVIAK
jgi:hypothetical protein